jgi:hypothetical protein
MRKLCFFAPAACLLIAVASTASAQLKVESVVTPGTDTSIGSFLGSAPTGNQKK